VHVAGALFDHGAQQLVQVDLQALFDAVHSLSRYCSGEGVGERRGPGSRHTWHKGRTSAATRGPTRLPQKPGIAERIPLARNLLSWRSGWCVGSESSGFVVST
jgi:hypothetical protein